MKISFISFSLIINNFFKLSQQLLEIFSYKVSSNWVEFGQIISWFPLVNVELGVSVVKTTIVIEYSSSYLQISETNSSGKSS